MRIIILREYEKLKESKKSIKSEKYNLEIELRKYVKLVRCTIDTCNKYDHDETLNSGHSYIYIYLVLILITGRRCKIRLRRYQETFYCVISETRTI